MKHKKPLKQRAIKLICPQCQSSKFELLHESVFYQRYSFLEKGSLKRCNNCGFCYQICPDCGNIVNMIHLSLDVFGLKVICSDCGHEFPKIKKWLQKTQAIYP
ncbi:MAG: hypothetical protein ACTSVU_00275 [Promethearchaeota archaeon]